MVNEVKILPESLREHPDGQYSVIVNVNQGYRVTIPHEVVEEILRGNVEKLEQNPLDMFTFENIIAYHEAILKKLKERKDENEDNI